jgi:hypothetical protein
MQREISRTEKNDSLSWTELDESSSPDCLRRPVNISKKYD